MPHSNGNTWPPDYRISWPSINFVQTSVIGNLFKMGHIFIGCKKGLVSVACKGTDIKLKKKCILIKERCL